MIRMIQFVAVALILTLASCDSNDSSSWNEELSDSWNEEPSEPCEAVGHASHGVGSTWTTLRIWNASGPTLPECEEECETIAAEFVHAIYTCMTACEVRGEYDDYHYHITESVVGRTTYRGRDVVMLETTYDDPNNPVSGATAGHVKVALSVAFPEPHIDYIDSCTGNLVARVDDSGITDFAPHDGKLSLPLEVGKTWTATHTITTPGGSSRVVTDEWEVTSFEEVNTPAGAFMAYRIVDHGWHMRGSSPSRSIYYDPDLALIIKENRYGDIRYLLSYDLK